MKWCGGCQQDLPTEAFARDPRKSDGLNTQCRKCKGAYNARWQRRNKAKVKARFERRRTRELTAPGHATPEQLAARLKFYGGLCGYCRERPFAVWDHAKPLSRGGSNWPANMIPACIPCNGSKRAKTWKEFFQFVLP